MVALWFRMSSREREVYVLGIRFQVLGSGD